MGSCSSVEKPEAEIVWYRLRAGLDITTGFGEKGKAALEKQRPAEIMKKELNKKCAGSCKQTTYASSWDSGVFSSTLQVVIEAQVDKALLVHSQLPGCMQNECCIGSVGFMDPVAGAISDGFRDSVMKNLRESGGDWVASLTYCECNEK
eukprot:Hpha_TRINITY_DN15087_c1_g2::TRINITY_DN15087_c1_g2_i1::g.124007::m.124007